MGVALKHPSSSSLCRGAMPGCCAWAEGNGLLFLAVGSAEYGALLPLALSHDRIVPMERIRRMQTLSPDVSRITDSLFLSSLPKHEHADHIWDLGVRLVVSMPLYRPPRVYCRAPFAFTHCPCIDSPFFPIPIFILRRGVAAALPVVERGDSVLIHCKSGVHRSVAMMTCILIAHGYTADDAMKFIVERRSVADPYAPHILSRIRAFERDWAGPRPSEKGIV